MEKRTEKLDPYCQKIVMTLIGKMEISFNALDKKVKVFGKFSRPTLSEHLKHLEEQKIIVKRVENESNLHMKPTFYSLNYNAMDKYLPGIKENIGDENKSWFRLFNMLDRHNDKLNFRRLAEETLRFVYMGDLTLTKLYLETYEKKEKESAELVVTRKIMSLALDLMLSKLYEISQKAEKGEIAKVIKEFDEQIERLNRYFKTGELDLKDRA